MRTTGSYQGPVKSTSFLYKIEIWPHFLFEPTRSKACIFFALVTDWNAMNYKQYLIFL